MPNADIFISYRRDQRERVMVIAEKLQELGLSAWFDARLEAGTSFDEEINREVRSAKAVLVCWSPEAIQSRWVRAEASVGLERDVLVAVYLRPTELMTPYNLVHTENLEGWSGALDVPAWRNVLDRIGGLVGRPKLADEAAAKALDADWLGLDQTERATFKSKLEEARRRFAAMHQAQPAVFDQSLREMTTAFESWILRRRLSELGLPPDPLVLVDDQAEALRLDLATARRERDVAATLASRTARDRSAGTPSRTAASGEVVSPPRRRSHFLLQLLGVLLSGPIALFRLDRRILGTIAALLWLVPFGGFFLGNIVSFVAMIVISVRQALARRKAAVLGAEAPP